MNLKVNHIAPIPLNPPIEKEKENLISNSAASKI